jgi:hypothetical protein
LRNCLILGSGRSGTSLTAGLLAQSGYYMGTKVYDGDPSNPKGVFEDGEINAINEVIIRDSTSTLAARFIQDRGPTRAWWLMRARLVSPWLRHNDARWGQRWLAVVPLQADIVASARTRRRIARQIVHAPFCFKDPRLCYTLPAWRPLLQDVVYVCVFREPARTANSIVRESDDAPYLRSLRMDFARAVSIWTLMYKHVLTRHCREGEWLFVHYDQILDGTAMPRLAETLEADLDESFPTPTLARSSADGTVPESASRIYDRLCELAHYSAR